MNMTIDELENLRKRTSVRDLIAMPEADAYMTQITKHKTLKALEFLGYDRLTPSQLVRRLKYDKFKDMRSIGPTTGVAFRKLITEFLLLEWSDGRGGAREGSGRPTKIYHHHHFSLSDDVHKILMLEPNMTTFVETAIRLKHKLDNREITW